MSHILFCDLLDQSNASTDPLKGHASPTGGVTWCQWRQTEAVTPKRKMNIIRLKHFDSAT